MHSSIKVLHLILYNNSVMTPLFSVIYYSSMSLGLSLNIPDSWSLSITEVLWE